MKALSLTQPWAQLMVLQPPFVRKEYETRSWNTAFRGVLAIHAAKGWPKWAQDFAMEEHTLGRLPGRIGRGGIVGLVRVTATYRTQDVELEVSALERRWGDYDWGRWAWRTELLHVLQEPVPCKGALGLWDVPDEVHSAIVAQIGAVV